MDKTAEPVPAERTGATSFGVVVAGLLSAPCFIGVMLIPLGLGAVMTSAAFKFLDTWRFLFMGVTLALLAVMHIGLRRSDVFRPTALVWIVTAIALALILGELFVDPPWARHANVPM